MSSIDDIAIVLITEAHDTNDETAQSSMKVIVKTIKEELSIDELKCVYSTLLWAIEETHHKLCVVSEINKLMEDSNGTIQDD